MSEIGHTTKDAIRGFGLAMAVAVLGLVGAALGWYVAILALELPFSPWSGALVAPALAAGAWWQRRRMWLCSRLTCAALAAAGGWVLLLVGGVALADF